MAFTQYEIIPGVPDGGGVQTSTDAGPVGPIEPFPAGALQDAVVIGNAIYNLPGTIGTDPDASWVLSSTGQNLYTQDVTYGTIRLMRENEFGYLNSSRSTRIDQGISGTIGVRLADGTLGSLSIDFASLGQTGVRLAWKYNEDGTRTVTQVQADQSLVQLQSAGLDVRGFLNSREAATYVVGARILQEYQLHRGVHTPETDAMIDQGKDLLGDRTAKDSAAILAYISANVEGLQVFSSRVFR